MPVFVSVYDWSSQNVVTNMLFLYRAYSYESQYAFYINLCNTAIHMKLSGYIKAMASKISSLICARIPPDRLCWSASCVQTAERLCIPLCVPSHHPC